ncbi:hypothetical protein [Archangium gephyra]|nr:hypothetical protein [Archangium gephyra]AKJ07711.1 Hypothetical protein AA314_09337 [Archangium gephyra]
MALSAEARELLRKGRVISTEVPASSPERVAWVGVHPYVDTRVAGRCSAPGIGKTRFVIRGCEASRASVEARRDLTDELENERKAIVTSEEQIETVLASWGVDSSRLGQDQGPYPY